MSQQHTLNTLRDLKLHGMAEALERQFQTPKLLEAGFEERLAMLLDAEHFARENRRLQRLLKQARLKVNACIEDIDYRPGRGLDRQQINGLLSCDWIERHQNLIITGPTGAGKTWLACALAHQAARCGLSASYRRLPRLLEDMAIAREAGNLPNVRTQLAKIKLLVLDDWGLATLNRRGRQDLLEIIDDRVNSSSTIITAQLPVAEWHAYLGEPTIADAILDRIVHSAHRIQLQGESMRKLKASKAKSSK
ncbi:IS21-like element ISPsy14 family helper ATPase IstB [Oleiagrimonas citrea]|uniref:ATP-binding protein n=1 Tax=Oleiagrimonas citrea TaxID=1665687 RepID=A0A846ZIA7_9GAMM|nr:IS21-like element helper ATPase IstB [Oleiagrimonas citrea]NKZ37359.1 ATP-binding protein [Oleiagrimonas citrea]